MSYSIQRVYRKRESTQSSPAANRTRDRRRSPGRNIAAAPGISLVKTQRGGTMLRLRSRLGFSRETFVRLLPMSIRSLATIEQGVCPTPAVARRLTEIGRVVDALSEVIAAESVGTWMLQPNPAFGGLKPIEVIERGETDRIWQTVFMLRSGNPS